MGYPNIIIFLVHVFAFAVPIAFFEIFIEKDKGWGAGLSKEKWYGKVVGENNPFMKLLAKIVGVPYFFGSGILMFFFLVPSLLLVDYFLIVRNLPLLFAAYFGISVVEDFLWFVFNWHFPALRELLKGPKGSIWWHQRWVKIFSGYYLPASYLTGLAIVRLCLLISRTIFNSRIIWFKLFPTRATDKANCAIIRVSALYSLTPAYVSSSHYP